MHASDYVLCGECGVKRPESELVYSVPTDKAEKTARCKDADVCTRLKACVAERAERDDLASARKGYSNGAA